MRFIRKITYTCTYTHRQIFFPSRKPNIFDNMMAMMEKYANNLEALVDERTDQLVEEKKKTGNIYCIMKRWGEGGWSE